MSDHIREIEEPAANPAPAASAGAPEKRVKEEGSFLWFCVKLILIVLIFRSFVFTSFNIPSESMMPRLLVGDYLFAAKWPYGYSSRSLPFNAPLIPGRIFASTPERGDVVIFEHPIDGTDYIKRVIGLPGETVQMVNGVVHINGQPVGFEQVEDFVLPIRPDGRCARVRFTEQLPDGTYACRYPQFRETLPNGVSYNVLDFGLEPQDVTPPITIPEGHLFMMGDNRDNSLDSRFPAEAQRGIGLVPEENVVARASFMYWSTDGNADWVKPWTWFTAARWNRLFQGI
ncbi:signal peptidase I [Altererythrobacter lauratis]|uniref:Signal peptidase I n=1 Tax=Alteraurantiacibacter lauratis TaxID=2054627 RepID=A0ABV7ECT3_9SPHN